MHVIAIIIVINIDYLLSYSGNKTESLVMMCHTGAVVTELSLSGSGVWAVTPSGEILFRYGISEKNRLGNYWKKIPGMIAHITGR